MGYSPLQGVLALTLLHALTACGPNTLDDLEVGICGGLNANVCYSCTEASPPTAQISMEFDKRDSVEPCTAARFDTARYTVVVTRDKEEIHRTKMGEPELTDENVCVSALMGHCQDWSTRCRSYSIIDVPADSCEPGRYRVRWDGLRHGRHSFRVE